MWEFHWWCQDLMIQERARERGVGVSWSSRQGERRQENIHRERATYNFIPSQSVNILPSNQPPLWPPLITLVLFSHTHTKAPALQKPNTVHFSGRRGPAIPTQIYTLLCTRTLTNLGLSWLHFMSQCSHCVATSYVQRYSRGLNGCFKMKWNS